MSSNSRIFNLNAQPGNKSYIEVTNAPAGPRLYDITDKDNVISIGFNQSGSSIDAIVRNTATKRELLLYSDNALITPVLERVNFREIDATAHDYVIISNKILRAPSGSISDPIDEYAKYRASATGGEYDTLTVDMGLLYDQYSYGEVSPLAIKNFTRFMVEQGDPQYFFLIGKGLDPLYNFHRNAAGFVEVTKLGVTRKVRDLVPSAGNPGSDISFLSGLNGTTYEPAVPIGRLPALNSSQVIAYLNKVKEMDDLPFDELWRKRLLHLSGGISAFELTQFKNFMDGFKAQAEDNFFGGDVTTISKETNSTVELINVADEVNAGLNLITFFGHSSPSVIDIDIGFVTDPVLGYNNTGRYPMFLINGCNAGQFFNQDILFGENWILAADKGALGFIAHASFGFSSSLRAYTDTFYETAYEDSVFINKSIGIIHKETARRFMEGRSATPINITQAQQMVLLGDPAVSLFGASFPDFEVNDDNVFAESFDTTPINAESDSFNVNVIVRNFGITSKDSLKVNITRTFADNSTIIYDSIFKSVQFRDTLTLTIDNDVSGSFGNNRFVITLDADNEIQELDETNNTATFDLFIPLFGTKNLFPVNYAIVNENPVTLRAQATDLFSDTRDFLFEIDTLKTFNSGFKKQATISGKVLATWQPDLLSKDSTVYYWRTKFAQPLAGESEEWSQSSFIYINNGPEGWSQTKFAQYDDNVLLGLERNAFDKTLDFEETETDLSIRTYGSANPAGVADISVQLNGIEYNIDNLKRCRDNTINFIAFDKNTTVPYAAIPFIFQDVRTCGRTPQVINSYRRTEFENNNDDLIDFFDAINDGDSVVMYSIGDPQYSLWSATVISKFEEIGVASADIAALQDGEPVILFGRKGNTPGTAQLFTTSDTPENEQEISQDAVISGIFSDGEMTSVTIGPASQWQSVITNVKISETPKTDDFSFDIIGIDNDANEVDLFTNQTDKIVDISSIDALQYPYLRLRYETSDAANLTAAQLAKWQVIYTGVPEGILLVNDDFNQEENVPEGQKIQLPLRFVNISDKNFSDSLMVNYGTFNTTSRTSDKLTTKILSPQINDTTSFELELKTLGKSGANDLNVFVNPRVEVEQYYENNILNITNYLNVNRDNINPLLDVVFDGERILDGEIVSPSPLIGITLKEENSFLQKKDTTGVRLFLKQVELDGQPCDACVFERVSFSSPNVEWFPATADSDFKVEYKPDPLEDGIYTLRVEAEDESGNESGTEPYSINFEVVNESTITNFYPYPNPFSTSTRFIFTLTGSVVPDEIKIQIMTVSGRVVREITQNELGPIRIGNNITDFAWNGKDEFGDQLANGVYIYRVLVQSNGQAIDSRETSADKAFKKGYGKLYLLR
nr:C25 family cysteine peptidase [Fulvivirga aurantia]